MKEVKKLYLTFKDVDGRVANVIIPEPKDEVNAAMANAVGELIMQKNVIDNRGKAFKSYEGAKIVTTTTEELA